MTSVTTQLYVSHLIKMTQIFHFQSIFKYIIFLTEKYQFNLAYCLLPCLNTFNVHFALDKQKLFVNQSTTGKNFTKLMNPYIHYQ
jgi:hypothetical protein